MLVEGGVRAEIAARRARIIYAWAMGQMLVSGDEAVPAETATALVAFGLKAHWIRKDSSVATSPRGLIAEGLNSRHLLHKRARL